MLTVVLTSSVFAYDCNFIVVRLTERETRYCHVFSSRILHTRTCEASRWPCRSMHNAICRYSRTLRYREFDKEVYQFSTAPSIGFSKNYLITVKCHVLVLSGTSSVNLSEVPKEPMCQLSVELSVVNGAVS